VPKSRKDVNGRVRGPLAVVDRREGTESITNRLGLPQLLNGSAHTRSIRKKREKRKKTDGRSKYRKRRESGFSGGVGIVLKAGGVKVSCIQS